MRVLLDESVPRGLLGLLQRYDVATVQSQGWRAMRNGQLLRVAEAEFDVFVTADQNLQFQQNFAEVDLGIVVLAAYRNRIESYLPVADRIREAIEKVSAGVVVVVDAGSGGGNPAR